MSIRSSTAARQCVCADIRLLLTLTGYTVTYCNHTTKQGAEDVEAMKIVLNEEQKKLEIATTETMKMLESLEVSSAEAKKEGDQVKRLIL
jgi:hypothetical protein